VTGYTGTMADLINLNRVRKQKQREADKGRAEANRLLHGTPKKLREANRKEALRSDRDLDGKKLDQD